MAVGAAPGGGFDSAGFSSSDFAGAGGAAGATAGFLFSP